MAKGAGIKGHEAVGLSAIGGSRVIQHWDVADDKNKAKAALRAGKVDVLTLSPIHLPDDGIEKFAALALEHNPKVRVTVQEFWPAVTLARYPPAGRSSPALSPAAAPPRSTLRPARPSRVSPPPPRRGRRS
jgi:hypothetical protein